jgi:hypothetical protein
LLQFISLLFIRTANAYLKNQRWRREFLAGGDVSRSRTSHGIFLNLHIEP